MKIYTFDAEQLTMDEIHERLQCISTTTIAKHIKRGRTTTTAILNYRPAKPRPNSRQQFAIGTKDAPKKAPSNMR